MRSARTSAALQFLTVGVALGLISSAVVASIEVGKSDPVEFAPDVAGPPGSRPLDTAPGIHWYHSHSAGELCGPDGVLEVVPLPGWTRRLDLAGRPAAVHTKAGAR